MKKILFLTALAAVCKFSAFAAAPSITINNNLNSSCGQASVKIAAYEPITGCYNLVTNVTVAGTPVSFADVTAVNVSLCTIPGSGPGWVGGLCAQTASGSEWVKAEVTIGGTMLGSVVNPSSSLCSSGFTVVTGSSGCGGITVTYSNDLAGNSIIDIN